MIGENEENINVFNNAVVIRPMDDKISDMIRYFFEVQTEIDDFYGCIDIVIYNGNVFEYYVFDKLKYINGMKPKDYLKSKIDTYHLIEYSKDDSNTIESNKYCHKIVIPDNRTVADYIIEDESSKTIKNETVPYSFVLALAVICDKYSDANNLEATLKSLKYNGDSIYDLLRR